MKLNLRPAILALCAVCLHDYTLGCVWQCGRDSLGGGFHRSGFSLTSRSCPSPSSPPRACPALNFSEDIMNTVCPLLFSWLAFCLLSPFFFLSPPHRDGSQEKDKTVSSSIVSSVQSKITQVLSFLFLTLLSQMRLLLHLTAELVKAIKIFFIMPYRFV